MGCCGRNRAALSKSAAPEIPPLQRAPPNVPSKGRQTQAVRPAGGVVSIRYIERSSVVVHGSTGRRYAFSATNPVQSVDARDAGAFWQSRFFRRA